MRIYISNEGTIESSKYLLNLISIVFHEAAKHRESMGFKTTAEQYKKYGNLIYNKLKESGFYDG